MCWQIKNDDYFDDAELLFIHNSLGAIIHSIKPSFFFFEEFIQRFRRFSHRRINHQESKIYGYPRSWLCLRRAVRENAFIGNSEKLIAKDNSRSPSCVSANKPMIYAQSVIDAYQVRTTEHCWQQQQQTCGVNTVHVTVGLLGTDRSKPCTCKRLVGWSQQLSTISPSQLLFYRSRLIWHQPIKDYRCVPPCSDALMRRRLRDPHINNWTDGRTNARLSTSLRPVIAHCRRHGHVDPTQHWQITPARLSTRRHWFVNCNHRRPNSTRFDLLMWICWRLGVAYHLLFNKSTINGGSGVWAFAVDVTHLWTFIIDARPPAVWELRVFSSVEYATRVYQHRQQVRQLL